MPQWFGPVLQFAKLLCGVALLVLSKDTVVTATGAALIGSAQGSLEPQPWKRKREPLQMRPHD